MKKCLPAIILSVFFTITGLSQNTTGITITLNSATLNESRKIQVYSPVQPASKNISYPVLYVFDAESLFLSAVSASQFMNHSSSFPQMPEAIIVGIFNTSRGRDMPVPQEIANTKGAGNFLKFITTELVPYINKNYPVNGLNVLVGHSQGGLFVTYAGLEQPQLFPFVLALDAPMTVNSSLLKEYQQKIAANCSLNYFSAETLFGWGKDFTPPATCDNYMQKKIEGETHETMPYKGMYDGLKFLFREYIPSQTGMSLQTMQEYYKNLSGKHHCKYDLPKPLLLASARQHINVSKKDGALSLIRYYEKEYGTDKIVTSLLAKVNAITKEPDQRVDYYLNHPGSPVDVLKPFMGKWKGTLFVTVGEDLGISWEINKINGKYIIDARVMNEFNERSDFLLVTEQNELAWGRKHNSGGIYLSIAKLSADGQELTGTEDLIGAQLPEGAPPFRPNTFKYTRIKD